MSCHGHEWLPWLSDPDFADVREVNESHCRFGLMDFDGVGLDGWMALAHVRRNGYYTIPEKSAFATYACLCDVHYVIV